MVMVSILETLSIALLIPIISNLINPDKNIQLYFIQYLGFLENLSKNEFIIVSFATVLIAYLIKNLFVLFFINFRSHFEANCQKFFASRLYTRYLDNKYEFHIQNNSSVLLRNVTVETDNPNMLLISITFLSEMLILLGITTFLLIFNFTFTLILIFILFIFGSFFVC